MVEIVPHSNEFGARVLSVNLENLSESDFQIIHDALLKYKFLVFDNQEYLTAKAQRDFSLRFGKLQIHPETPAHYPEFEDVNVISNMKDENGVPVGLYGKNAEVYHSDVSWGKICNKVTFLRAKITPSVGGDTWYADATTAYDDLDENWKKRIQGLQAHYTYLKFRPWVPGVEDKSEVFADIAEGSIHPVVATHRLTKKKMIFANEGHTDHIVGVSKEESDEILDYLFKHVDNEKYRYIHRWKPFEAVLWDNRALHHRATDPPEEDRYLVRTTVIDDFEPVEEL